MPLIMNFLGIVKIYRMHKENTENTFTQPFKFQGIKGNQRFCSMNV